MVKDAVGGSSKRLFDLTLAITLLIAMAPIMVLVAALIKLTLGGPVLYSHPRVGFRGRMFPCFKFRSMVVNGDEVLEAHLAHNAEARREWEETQKLRDDPRVTRLGRVLRLSSLDELPQIFNVIRGEMSCVGPRPIVPSEQHRYGDHISHYLSARPGLTGLWQVSGRSSCSYEARVALDCSYVTRWSHLLDLQILLRTIPAVLHPNHAA